MSLTTFKGQIRLNKTQKINLLKLARKKLEKRNGWLKGEFVSKYQGKSENETGYCLHGACNAAFNELYKEKKGGVAEATQEVGRHISLEDFVRRTKKHSIVNFNDDAKTRKKDVLAVIDGKIEELENS